MRLRDLALGACLLVSLLAIGCGEQFSPSGERWADRLSFAIANRDAAELVNSCRSARDWHDARRDDNDLIKDWIILSEACDQALGGDWGGAAKRLADARP